MSEKTGSKILYPYKIVGLVCGNVRICVNQLGNDVFFTVPIGRAFQIFDGDKLGLVMVSPQLSQDISAIQVNRDITYTAVGKDILVWKRFTLKNTFVGDQGDIVCLLLIGDYIVSATVDGFICIWNCETNELIRTINLGSDFNPSFLIHPNTYINKILVGSASGKLQLWNIRTGSLIMNFKEQSSPITFIEQSPSVDVVAVGRADGHIDIINLQYDESVMSFQQNSAVTGLSFFSNMTKAPLMLSAGVNGHICLWDIKEKRLSYEIEDAHQSAVHSAMFLLNQAVFISAGCDNCIKMWALDEVDHSPRVLKSRQGHTLGSNVIKFYGYNSVIAREDGGDGLSMNILSAGLDQGFRSFHVMRDQLSAELSQGGIVKKLKSTLKTEIEKKLPVIIEGRDRDWSNIATCHSNTIDVYTWRYLHKTIGEHVLHPPKTTHRPDNYALCCDVSNNGETVVVGYRQGDIHLFNIQSGKYRGSLPHEAKAGFILKESLYGFVGTGARNEGEGKHKDQVICVGIDILNTHVISVARDNTIHIWSIADRVLLKEIVIAATVIAATYSRSTGLLAVATTSRVVLVYDCETLTLIRRFEGLCGEITAMCFDESGRWIIVADNAKQLRIYDVPNSRLIDWVQFDHAVTAVSVSYNNEFIATAHDGTIGIHLWANTAFYSDVLVDHIPTAPVMMDRPTTRVVHEIDTDVEVVPEGSAVVLAPAVAGGSLQLTHGPKTKWATLANLELIKERNKPVEAPKAPEKAPFFMNTIAGIVPQFTTEPRMAEESEVTESRFTTRTDVLSIENELQAMLHEAAKTMKSCADDEIDDERDVQSVFGSFYPVLEYFRSSSVSAADAQLNMICMGNFDEIGKMALYNLFVFFSIAVKAEIDFEMIQSILDRTLQLYSEMIPTIPGIQELLKEIAEKQEESWKHMQGLFQNSLCLVELFSNVQL